MTATGAESDGKHHEETAMDTYRKLREELFATANELVGEFAELPAGMVLRNFARAVRFARLVETSNDELPQQAANITRVALGSHEVLLQAQLPRGA